MLIRDQNRNRIAGLALGIVALSSFCTHTAAAQEQDPPQPIITVHSGGLDGLFVSPKDAGLKTALRLLDERINELPAETGDASMPAPVISFVVDLLTRPMSLRAALLPGIEDIDFDNMESPPFSMQLDFYTASPDEAGTLAGKLNELIAAQLPEAPRPDPQHDGLFLTEADGTTLQYGAGRVGGQNAVSIAMNGYATDVARINLTGLPQGVQPAFAMDYNTTPMMPLLKMAIEQSPPDQRAMLEMQLGMYGMTGDNPLRVIAAAGYSADRGHGFARVINGKHIAAQQKSLPDNTLTENDLRLIPVDAIVAEAGKFNPAYFTNLMEMIREQMPPHAQGQDPFEMFQQQTGIDLDRDIIANIGQTYWTYTAESTGGGLTGYVSIVELSDAAGMQDTLDNLTQMANQMAHGPARGYVRFMNREIGGHTMTVLTFPGIPVPLELTLAIIGDRFYAAMSPQSVVFAAAQAANPAQSILDNPRFREMGGGVPEGALQVGFMDTPKLARSGYGLVNMGMAALANAVRSPSNPDREPGLLMPSVSELMNGAKATVYVTRFDGNDVVMQSQGDRSTLVNLCGAAGAMGGASGAVMLGAIVGGITPAIGRARTQATNVQSMAQLRQIAVAVHTHAAEHGDQLPNDLDQLVEAGYLTRQMLDSPLGDATNGYDFGFRGGGRFAEGRFPDRQILAWDRVMLNIGGPVNVLFADGHVESLLQHELQNLLAHPANEGLNLHDH